MVEVSGRQQHAHVPLLHQVNQLADVLGCRGNPGLGLDVVDAGNAKLSREVVPLFVVARHLYAAKDLALLEPAAQPVGERGALVASLAEKIEQLTLPIEIAERLAAEDRDELIAVQRAVHTIFEIFFARGEVCRILR